MTLQERIEKAARALDEFIDDWDGATLERIARVALFGGIPELYSEGDNPPTHWLAPWEADGKMDCVGSDARWRSAVRDPDNVREIYTAMRDSYLNRETE